MENKDKYKAKFAAKWTEDVANRGFVPVPKCLITCMGDLDLQPQEAAILFNIIEKCWKAGEVSWQKVDTMATNIGRKNSATRVITKSLAKKGFITKTQQFNSSSIYDLEPLILKLDKHMKECRHTARKPEGGSQKSGGLDSQKSSDYLEPILNRTTYIKPNNNSDDFLKNDKHVESSNDVRLIYDCFIKEFDKNPAYYKLTYKRKSKIEARLKDAGFDMLKMAIENAVLNDYFMGKSPSGWAVDLDWIIDSYERVEKVLNLKPSKSEKERRSEKNLKERHEAFMRERQEAPAPS